MGRIRSLQNGNDWNSTLLLDSGTSATVIVIGTHAHQSFTNGAPVSGKALADQVGIAYADRYGHDFEASTDPFE